MQQGLEITEMACKKQIKSVCQKSKQSAIGAEIIHYLPKYCKCTVTHIFHWSAGMSLYFKSTTIFSVTKCKILEMCLPFAILIQHYGAQGKVIKFFFFHLHAHAQLFKILVAFSAGVSQLPTYISLFYISLRWKHDVCLSAGSENWKTIDVSIFIFFAQGV